MARLFDDGSSEYLQVESAAITAYPFAMACWFNSNDDTVSQALIWVGDKDVATYYTVLLAYSGTNIGAFSHNYGAAAADTANTSTGWSANTWHHAAGIWLSTSERHAYLDGSGKGSNTTVVGALANHDRTAIGASRDSTDRRYMSGHIAEAAIWNLTDWGANDAERETNFEKAIASMAKGYSPKSFPLGRVSYWDLIRSLNDTTGGLNMTASGTVVSAHTRMIYPARPQM